jgi:hypothetical protein
VTIDKFDPIAHFDRLPDSAGVSKLTSAAILDEAIRTIERRIDRGELIAITCGKLVKIQVGSIRRLLNFRVPGQEEAPKPAPAKRGVGRPRKVKQEAEVPT